ncbi:hypothetical protein [Afifella marina]|uniref:Uncharacterized protein n=1 Tax=Afifella marina DSM 2698 TaxID=1120955 RepID=A0A1G5PB75_AFIMA|nr:hypothetical protein [Afifella marina]MBK1625428.1 hypothetical protein [Afifella marina DSM 2698]MBK1629132.1 hypothetical protein [Afifella marina]MBK5917324.1 hypothetical protein [Afifella marina]RAI17319.1 hypothetical protein CH311_18445 [Afifella marina DSM 2698]SCZ46802.1 hypothetical protein SAMN03080610_03731 [Afifella marina DSM 2698]
MRKTKPRRPEQKDKQRAYRARQKAERIPSRDDVARIVLHWAITGALAPGQEKQLSGLRNMVIDKLVEQDFSEDGARRRFDEIVERYENGWDFRAKPHLLRVKEGIPDDEAP